MKSLSAWCSTQRVYYRAGTLEQSRLDRLQDAGFVFNEREQEHSWELRLKELIKFNEEQNGSKSPKHNMSDCLKRWCDRQRRKYREGKLEKDQVDNLREACFDFTLGKVYWEPFEKMYCLLADFYEGMSLLQSLSTLRFFYTQLLVSIY